MKTKEKRPVQPKQQIRVKKGMEEKMDPQPVYEIEKKLNRLDGKVAIITGADSGIGRAIAIAFIKEGAKVVVNYYEDDIDAGITAGVIEKYGGEYELAKGDVSDPKFCKKLVDLALKKWGKLDVVINNAAVQTPQKFLKDISPRQLQRTFEVNFFAQLYLVQAAEPHLKEGASIINTSSVTAYRGNIELIDYSATKGAIVSLTRTLAGYFSKKKIRVNAVAPGPIWTPLIPSTFDAKHVEGFGSDTPLGRPGQPVEVAYCFVFLASDESSYISGQVLHPNGGEIING